MWNTGGIILSGPKWVEDVSQCHSVNHKSPMDWAGIEPRSLQEKRGICLSHGTAGTTAGLVTGIGNGDRM